METDDKNEDQEEEELHDTIRFKNVYLIKSQGNMCYSLAGLSSLLYQDPIRNFVIDNRKSSHPCKMLCNLMLNPIEGQGNWLRKLFADMDPKYTNGKQYDSAKFLYHLLDKIDVSRI